jgi:hypothetical protein
MLYAHLFPLRKILYETLAKPQAICQLLALFLNVMSNQK